MIVQVPPLVFVVVVVGAVVVGTVVVWRTGSRRREDEEQDGPRDIAGPALSMAPSTLEHSSRASLTSQCQLYQWSTKS